jgi:hypothetical protein
METIEFFEYFERELYEKRIFGRYKSLSKQNTLLLVL